MVLKLLDINWLVEHWIWPLNTDVDTKITNLIVADNLKGEIFFFLVIIVLFIVDLNSFDKLTLKVLCSLLHPLIEFIFLHDDILSVKVRHKDRALLVVLLLRLLQGTSWLLLSSHHRNWDWYMDGWSGFLTEVRHLTCSQNIGWLIYCMLLSLNLVIPIVFRIKWLGAQRIVGLL